MIIVRSAAFGNPAPIWYCPKQLVDYRVSKEDLPLFGRQHEGTWGASEHCAMLPDGRYIILIDAVALKFTNLFGVESHFIKVKAIHLLSL